MVLAVRRHRAGHAQRGRRADPLCRAVQRRVRPAAVRRRDAHAARHRHQHRQRAVGRARRGEPRVPHPRRGGEHRRVGRSAHAARRHGGRCVQDGAAHLHRAGGDGRLHADHRSGARGRRVARLDDASRDDRWQRLRRRIRGEHDAGRRDDRRAHLAAPQHRQLRAAAPRRDRTEPAPPLVPRVRLERERRHVGRPARHPPRRHPGGRERERGHRRAAPVARRRLRDQVGHGPGGRRVALRVRHHVQGRSHQRPARRDLLRQGLRSRRRHEPVGRAGHGHRRRGRAAHRRADRRLVLPRHDAPADRS